ncbi:40S ribosomal protein S10-like isoform X1 [Eurytemora carolleeae]|uniref:40S ribosomal protein S10-like isoform X1 n=1 Tax=Eurytemora carolleeae TaxID=1294199 RepID=UPI000C78B781|nr:40S ribosomal protein S10-like isoform X1 [Eurytemora carolleeae]|eukprot:XP_023341515.1 40S ribosomal protein S10-like isoform X1 [Eurytemora affinis]
MLMPKANRVAIYEHLFKEGVMVAERNTKAPKHPELETIPNLQVIKALTSLKSKGHVKEQFAWRHFYWYLTESGIQYLRDYLHLPTEIVPATMKRQAPKDARPARSAAPRREAKEGEGDRAAYRRAAGEGADKAADAGPGAAPMEFRGGYGRGKPAQ